MVSGEVRLLAIPFFFYFRGNFIIPSRAAEIRRSSPPLRNVAERVVARFALLRFIRVP